ncbi:hypothetical protein C7387_0696 [Yokenella regensburgei]|uniref:Uncharacterized protein n=1 Tax=Yokenella regensburgei TaxID=158877 RepID=A0ABX9RZN2_9ENTR|nr:hypothetical protein C7387_0696 [Yokenella regensburgei]VFS25664.1 Uncharacterised protein [Yokenella regensburgei]
MLEQMLISITVNLIWALIVFIAKSVFEYCKRHFKH